MLQKHPEQYTPEELEAWVRHLVDEQVSEGKRLDYKATISLKKQDDRCEAAKDISSFANEIGGTILYGIPASSKNHLETHAKMAIVCQKMARCINFSVHYGIK